VSVVGRRRAERGGESKMKVESIDEKQNAKGGGGGMFVRGLVMSRVQANKQVCTQSQM